MMNRQPNPSRITAAQLRALLAQNALLLDVRTPQEYAQGHIPGAVSLPLDRLEDGGWANLPRGCAVAVYCRTGRRSAVAARVLADAGFAPVYDLGGLPRWDGPLTR